MFDVWLDTNIVRPWNLQLDTAEADKFFKYAEDFALRIFIPEVVLRELIQHYVREALQCLQRQAELKRRLAHLDLPAPDEKEAPPPTDLDARYRDILTRRCAERSITIVPLGNVPISRLIDMAVKRTPPFQEKGERGFRDAVILFSILDYAQQHNQAKVVLISADKVFNEEPVSALVRESGLDLQVYEAVDIFTAYLETLLSKAKQRMRLLQAERVRAFLLDHENEIHDFIEKNTEFEERFLSAGLLGGRINRIVSIALKDIPKVTTISEGPKEKRAVTLLITFAVLLEIEVEVDRLWVPQEPQRYRVGQEVEQVVHTFVAPRREITHVEREVRCEATAKQRGKSLTDLELKEVKTGPFGFGALLARALGPEPAPGATE